MATSRGEGPAGKQRPGQIYDVAMRGLMEDDPVAACELLGVEVAGRPEVLPSVFAPGILTADLLLRVGPGRLAHVEYVRRASGDLAVRMLGYRWAIMRERDGELLSQHVIVLGEGWVRGHDDLEQNGFRLDLNVIYLREVDPAGWLQNPSLAPLAALGRGSAAEAFARSLQVIRKRGGLRADRLVQFATSLAAVTLDVPIIWKILEEVGMSVDSVADLFRDTKFGQALVEQGREQGREQGLELARQVLVTLLQDRFGPHPDLPAIAHRLAQWPDVAAAVHAISEAKTLADLAERSSSN